MPLLITTGAYDKTTHLYTHDRRGKSLTCILPAKFFTSAMGNKQTVSKAGIK